MSRDVSLTCPFCEGRGKGPDPTGNLHVKGGTTLYHCFRCGASPRTTGKLPPDVLMKLTLSDRGWLTDSRHQVSVSREEYGVVEDPHWADDCEECSSYLEQRGYFAARLTAHVFGGHYMGHRIFFSGEDARSPDDLASRWLQGRATSPRNPVRYISRPGYGRPMVHLMKPTASTPTTIPVVVEGPFDGLRLVDYGITALVLFGVSYSPAKVAEVQRLLWKESRVMLALDRVGTEYESRTWLWQLAKFIDVRLWPIQADDPDTMDLLELKQLYREVTCA